MAFFGHDAKGYRRPFDENATPTCKSRCRAGVDGGGHGSDPCLPGEDPTFTLGKGELEYQELDADDGMAELIHGPQGGYHLNLAVHATFLDPDEPWVARLEGTIDGELVGATSPYVTARCNREANALQGWGLLLIWDTTDPTELHGRVTTIEATITDAAGTVLSDSGDVEIFYPELE